MARVFEAAATLLDLYRAQFKTTIALQLQYRMQLVIWLLFSVLEPVVYLVVWTTVANSQGGTVGGFTVPEFAAYYIAVMVVNHLVFTWIMFEFEFRVRQGQFSPRLLRPVHPIHNDIADNVTYKLLTLVVMLPAAAVLTWLFQPAFHFQAWTVAAFFPALVLAFFLRFLTEWSFALAAFWTTRVAAFNDVIALLSIFLSGWAAPLALFPPAIRAVAYVLPFRWGLAFPAELLLGRLTPQEAATGFAMQAAWLAVAVVGLRLAWGAGVRRYSAVGA
jgi:ABC-2 type transport system permease protein